MQATQTPASPVSTAPAAPETQIVTRWKVSCCGDEARGLGHPLVWLAIPRDTGWVECGYCDKRFVIDRDHAHEDH